MEVTSADLKITDMQCTGVRSGNEVTVTTEITIHNDHDDAARHIQVIVVLPPTSHVMSTTPGAVIGPSYPPTTGSPWSTNGYVIFLHPDSMGVGVTFKAQYAFQGLVFPGIANVMDSGKVSHFR